MPSIAWIAVYVVGIARLGRDQRRQSCRKPGVRTFDLQDACRVPAVLRLRLLLHSVLGHFTPRQLGTFWPIYFMLFYSIAGLWFGYAFVAIGLAITALTLVGYFFTGDAFELWMAFVNGGGLILGGLWMRRS